LKLVLFDIDGTILLTDGAGKRAMDRALIEVFGSRGPDDHPFGGKTDPQIVRELMRIVGHEDPHIDTHMPALLDRYLAYLGQELDAGASKVETMPGIHALLDVLDQRHDVIVGLLTGNLVAGARAKLAAVGLEFERFKVGAFGSDHEARGELPAVAQRRAREQLGVDVAGPDVVVIGDTPADIHCGQSIGARAIAVATGHYSVDDLRAHHPAVVFEDLADTAAVVAAIVA
jgi:phosphoglycolate phosphatase-like HAD superfamily hydrolase